MSAINHLSPSPPRPLTSKGPTYSRC